MSDQLTIHIAHPLPDDVFERADVLTKIRPALAQMQATLLEVGIEISPVTTIAPVRSAEPAIKRGRKPRVVKVADVGPAHKAAHPPRAA